MKNIVLLGGSNSVKVNGLQKGLREYANVTNLALGSSTSIQNLYELYRPKNQEAIKNADLIITESNINETYNSSDCKENLPLDIVFKNLQYLYATLYAFKKPVCILILPYWVRGFQIVINMHRFLANYYGLNIVDIQSYYQHNEITQFENKFDAHQLAVVNRNVGKEIAKNIDCFKISNKNLDIHLPEFQILTPKQIQRNGNFKIFNVKNSAFDEIIYRLDKDNSLSIDGYEGWQIIGMHAWNLDNNGDIAKIAFANALKLDGAIHLKSDKISIVKQTASLNQFCEIQVEPVIDSKMVAKFNDENLLNTEFYHAAFSWYPDSKSLPYFDLIAFFLCKPNPKMKLFDLSIIPSDVDIEIDKDIDCSYLIPNIVFFKDSMEFIDEYIGYLYPNITKHIDNVLTPNILKRVNTEIAPQIKQQILELINSSNTHLTQSQYNTATNRIKNQLSYKLGRAMIDNSKSLWGYIRMPYVLSYIRDIHNKEQMAYNERIKKNPSLKLPPLESYPDYKEALKCKEHLSYKLGQALIKAHKNWYKSGYVKLWFEMREIKKEHKNR